MKLILFIYIFLVSSSITLGKTCSDRQGGVSKLYLFPYIKYSKSLNLVQDQKVVTFPSTVIYEYEAEGISFSESTSLKNGGVEWTQKLDFTITEANVSSEVYKLLNKDYSAIILDRNGNYRFIGMRNGAETSVKASTGTSKSDLNGYNVSLTAKEDNQAYYVPLFDSLFTVVVPVKFTLPNRPSNLRYRAYTGGSSITLDWGASVAGTLPIAGYYFYINGVYSSTPAWGDLDITLTDLEPNKEYKFYVKSVDSKGNLSGASNAVIVTSVGGGAYELRVANDFGYTESLECINI